MADDVPRQVSLERVSEEVSFYLRHTGQGPALVLGSGDGRLVRALAREGRAVVAVENAPALAKVASARLAREVPEVRERVELLDADPRALRLARHFPAVIAPRGALVLFGPASAEAIAATAAAHLERGGSFVFDLATGTEGDEPRFAPSHLAVRGGRTPRSRLSSRRLAVEAVDRVLSAVGLAAHERYGDFSASPFDPGDPLQIVLARPRSL
jgi:cyclopropane fatty-acyl-phospholipid synthase-like methyltransferase